MAGRFLIVVLAGLLLASSPAAEGPAPAAGGPGEAPAEAAAAPEQPFISDADWNRSRATPAAGAPTTAPPPAGKAVVAMAGSLAVVLGLAVCSVFLLRRLARRRGGPTSGRHLDLVETVHLGVKRSVVVLRLGDHVVLVGQSEHGLRGLGTFPASALGARPEPPPGVAVTAAPPATPSSFATLLASVTGKRR